MITAGHVYSEVATKALEDAQSKANTHTVLSFDRRSTRFLVEERQNPREVRPPGRFEFAWTNCGVTVGNFKNYIYHAPMFLLHVNMHTRFFYVHLTCVHLRSSLSCLRRLIW